jgi:hypothetical protein
MRYVSLEERILQLLQFALSEHKYKISVQYLTDVR